MVRPIALVAVFAIAHPPAVLGQSGAHEWGIQNVPEFTPHFDAQFRAPIKVSEYTLKTEILADGLTHPWAVEELPDNRGVLVAERAGRLRHIAPDGTVSDPIEGLPAVENRPPESGWDTQAGLLDVKRGPDFEQTRWIYFTYSKPLANDKSVTATARGRLSKDLTQIDDIENLFVQEPPSPTRMHYGSRIVFDGRGHAFITTGEHSSLMERDFSQQLDKTYGKIVRLNLDGSIPQNNPYVGVEGADDAIWSYGHRNVQGAVMRNGRLLTLEHGPAGGDELNVPLPARNYGWPVVSYGQRYAGVKVGTGKSSMAGMQEPMYYWDPVIAPGDLALYEGDMFPEWRGDLLAGALVAPGIVRLEIGGQLVTGEERLLTDTGRTRDIEVLRDGSLLITTDYDDGAVLHVTRAEAG